MDSFFRLSEESHYALEAGNGQLRQEAKMEYLAPSVKTFAGGVENELEVFQHQLQNLDQEVTQSSKPRVAAGSAPSRYESQKRRDWNSFGQYLRNHRPPIALEQCSGAHVIEFLRYLDQFGKTKVHVPSCHYFGVPNPLHPCPCPLRQAWGSLDALIGRLRAAFEENGGKASMNPFGARLIRLYLREVRETQAKARGIAYGKKKKGRISPQTSMLPVVSSTASTEQGSYGSHDHHFPQQLAGNMHGSVSSNFSIHGHDISRSSASQGYAVDSFNPSNSAVNLVSRVYPPFEIHSFMEDLPSRDANGWVWNPVCG